MTARPYAINLALPTPDVPYTNEDGTLNPLWRAWKEDVTALLSYKGDDSVLEATNSEVTFERIVARAVSEGATLVEPAGTDTSVGLSSIIADQGPATYTDNEVIFTIPSTNLGDSITANVIIGYSDRSNLTAQLYQHFVARDNIRDWKVIVDAGADANNRYVPLNGRIDGQAGSTSVVVVPDGGTIATGAGQRWKWVKLSYTHNKR